MHQCNNLSPGVLPCIFICKILLNARTHWIDICSTLHSSCRYYSRCHILSILSTLVAMLDVFFPSGFDIVDRSICRRRWWADVLAAGGIPLPVRGVSNSGDTIQPGPGRATQFTAGKSARVLIKKTLMEYPGFIVKVTMMISFLSFLTAHVVQIYMYP